MRSRASLVLLAVGLTFAVNRPAGGQFGPAALPPGFGGVSMESYYAGPPGTPAAGTPALHPGLMDELVLKSAGLGVDGPALVGFLRTRTEGKAGPDRLAALVRDLGDASGVKRTRAVGELVALGPAAVPALRQAVKDVDDYERSSNARRCLQAIEGGSAVAEAAVRLVARTRPEGAAEALLAFLPFGDDEHVVDEVKEALLAVASAGAEPQPALLRALEDPSSLRRAVAAEVICTTGVGAPPEAVRKLLQDPRPLVRLRVGLILAERKDADAVSALIGLLSDLPAAQARPAEDFLFTLAGDQSPKVALGNDAASAKKCREAWAAWWARSEGPGLLEEFRKRIPNETGREKIATLIDRLADNEYAVREKATLDLMSRGEAAVPYLQEAMKNPELEVRQRAQRCLDNLSRGKANPALETTARLVAFRKPEGAAEVLLAYLPHAEDDAVRAEVQNSLVDVAARDGKLEPAVARALDSKSPLCRAAAAEALCWVGAVGQHPEVRRLLQDPDFTVRFRSALALAQTRDKSAVPVLIGLLPNLSADQASQAEDYLRKLAGPKAPEVPLGSDATARARARDAWDQWWRGAESAVAMVTVPRPSLQRYLGYTMVVLGDVGQVVEFGRDGKQRWQLTGLQSPFDAQVLPGNRVLVAETNARRVTERNLKNEILWQKDAEWPIGCQRLTNGHTFIVCRNRLVEVDRGGKDVFTYDRPNGDIMAAQKLRDGRIVMATQMQTCVWMEVTGPNSTKEVKTITVGPVWTNCIDVLPNGNVLIPQQWNDHIVEFDSTGKSVWEASTRQPISAVRLPNGNTLVASQWHPWKVYEIDRAGKEVWELAVPNRPVRARRR